VLSSDEQSFAAFERLSEMDTFTIRHDTLFLNDRSYDFSGRNLVNPDHPLNRVKAYQEFWHSWRTFHPNTLQYASQ
jgi:hypothetical protein